MSKLILITLRSDIENPLLITEDELKDLKETKLQYNGMIRSLNPEDKGYRKTKVNKSKLNFIRTPNCTLEKVEMEAWCLEEDVSAVLFNMQEQLKRLMNEQTEIVNRWQILQNKRKIELGL